MQLKQLLQGGLGHLKQHNGQDAWNTHSNAVKEVLMEWHGIGVHEKSMKYSTTQGTARKAYLMGDWVEITYTGYAFGQGAGFYAGSGQHVCMHTKAH